MNARAAVLGESAPPLAWSECVQGDAADFEQLVGNVTLVEVFQVNCPGCFLYALPAAIELHRKYAEAGLSVVGIATAFEDFDKNTLENLRRLAANGEVIGETFKMLAARGLLADGRLPYRIPFPLAMDRLTARADAAGEDEVLSYAEARVPDFANKPESYRRQILNQVRAYLEKLEFRAETFERFQLHGTPSQLLIDRQGRLRACEFGVFSGLEMQVLALLREQPLGI